MKKYAMPILAALLAVALIAVSVTFSNTVQEKDRLIADATALQTSTDATLADTQAKLTETEGKLAETEGTLASTQATLTETVHRIEPYVHEVFDACLYKDTHFRRYLKRHLEG